LNNFVNIRSEFFLIENITKMKKSILNKILAAAIAYATPLVIDYIAKKFFNKKQKLEANKPLAQK
jgi:uncharacterized membrane protein